MNDQELKDYNPEAKRPIEEKGCWLLFLTPLKGKHFTPIKAVFGKIKTLMRNSYSLSLAAREKRHRTKAELRMAIRMGCTHVTPVDLDGYFGHRRKRKCFEQMYSHVQLSATKLALEPCTESRDRITE